MIRLRALERYAQPAAPIRNEARGDRCELCGATVGPKHAHVVDLEHRSLCCACRACSLLFEKPGAAGGQFRTVPDRVRTQPGYALAAARWRTLGVPVRLAFFFFNSRLGKWVALYPSPAGATEAEVPEEAWKAFSAECALVGAAQPDVEAVLVRGGRGEEGLTVHLVPIDACYELVGTLRRLWKGFDGGDEARAAIDAFFNRVEQRSRPLEGGAR